MTEIETKTEEKKLTQTVAQVMRALKPFLPPGAQKISVNAGLGYEWPNKVAVEILTVCRWGTGEEEKRECRAYSVSLVPAGPYRRSSTYGRGAGLRTRAFKPRKDGSFGAENIAAAIQQMLKDVETMKAAEAKREADRKAENAKEKAFNKTVLDFLKRDGFNAEMLTEYSGGSLLPRPKPAPEEFDEVPWYDQKQHAKLRGISFEDMRRVLRLLAIKGKK